MANDSKNSGLPLSQIARLVYNAREEFGWQITDPADLVNRLKLLEIGLPVEDEFIALVSWLGKCKLIHKLDQEQYPLTCRDSYQVPDMLAVFENEKNLIPVLIEVKATTRNHQKPLSWKPDYLEKIKRYAQLLNLPLLIAWKFRMKDMNLSFWLLFDVEIFEKSGEKFQVTFESASSENLLGQLAGDFLIVIKPGTSLNLELSPIGDDWKEENSTSDLFGKLRVFGANKNGEEIPEIKDDGVSRGLFSMLQCIPLSGSHSSYKTDSTIVQNWKLEHNEPLFLHQIMPILLAQGVSTDGEPIWSRILRENRFPVLSGEILKAAEYSGIAEMLFGQLPKTTPSFLQRKAG